MAISLTGIKDNVIASSGARQAIHASTVAADSMKNAFIASGILHVVVVIIAMVGVPFFVKDEPLIITPVSIELVDIADVTQTNLRAPPKKQEKPKEIVKPEKPKEAPKPPEPAPKVEKENPPEIKEVKKEPPKPEPIPEPKPEPEPEPEPEA